MHMPGHKQGCGAHLAAQAVLGDTAMRHDFTELEGTHVNPVSVMMPARTTVCACAWTRVG